MSVSIFRKPIPYTRTERNVTNTGVKTHTYWMVSFRKNGKIVCHHIGSVAKTTKAEAEAKAIQIKARELGQDTILPTTKPSAPDIAKIKADRAALIAREAERILNTPVSCDRKSRDCLPQPKPPVEATQFMVCNTFDSDFQAYPSEADHCPKCTSSDLRELEYTDHTIYTRIWHPYHVRSKRLRTATERIEYLRTATKRSKYKPVLEIQEGWIDSIPLLTLDDYDRRAMDLGDEDRYAWYARCGDYEFVGHKTSDDAKTELIKRCSGCTSHKEGCWKPAQEPEDLPESDLTKAEILGLEPSHDRCEVIDVPEGRIFWCKDKFHWMTACFEPDPDGIDHTTEKAVREALTKHCQACQTRKDKCWKPSQEPETMSESTMSHAEVREIDTSEWDRDLTPPRPSDHKKKVDHSFMRRRRLDPRGRPPNIMDENAKAVWDSGTPISKSDSQRMARIKAAISGVIGPWKMWSIDGGDEMLAGWVRSSDGSWQFGAVHPKGYDIRANHPELHKLMDIMDIIVAG